MYMHLGMHASMHACTYLCCLHVCLLYACILEDSSITITIMMTMIVIVIMSSGVLSGTRHTLNGQYPACHNHSAHKHQY